MTNVEFLEVTQEIEKFYEKELCAEQSRVWFEELKYLTKDRYRQISKECYRTLKFMPKLADIIEINKLLHIPIKNNNDITECKCNKCNGIGIVFYTKIEEGFLYEYGARCNCQNGLRKSHKIPDIDKVGIDV
ncbi:MAG: hypothetical protein HFJ48_06355 [Clostridia bacterium]|nr:hypothetical protein [Clostridia bacterium]